MKFSDLRTVMLPEGRLIIRLYSSGDRVIDSGAVVLFNLNDQLNDAEVKLVYVSECIQHVDLLIPDKQFEETNWNEFFGKNVFQSETPQFNPDNFPDEGV